MDSKLTLKLDQLVIERAKIYAKMKNTSLSQLIETYLNFLTNPADQKDDVTPLVKSLSGVIDLPKGFDSRSNYRSYLKKKYSGNK